MVIKCKSKLCVSPSSQISVAHSFASGFLFQTLSNHLLFFNILQKIPAKFHKHHTLSFSPCTQFPKTLPSSHLEMLEFNPI